jgi:integrase
MTDNPAAGAGSTAPSPRRRPARPAVPGPDTLVLRNRPLRPDTDPAALSRFGDDRWVLTPAIFEDHAKATSVNFAPLPACFQPTAKRYVFAQLDHPDPPGLPGGSCGRLAVHTIATNVKHLAAFLLWLHGRRIARLDQVTGEDLDAYLRDVLAAGRGVGLMADRVNEVRRLWAHRALLPAGDRLPDAPPWQGTDTAALVGRRVAAPENRTPRIQPATMNRLLAWALRFVEVFADDVLAARAEHATLSQRNPRARKRGESPRSARWSGDLERDVGVLLDELRAAGVPLPGRPRPDGGREVDWGHLGRMLNSQASSLRRPGVRRLVETSGLPIADGAWLRAPITGRLDGRPWRDRPIGFEEAPVLARHLSAACFVVVAYLSGMRPGEVLTLQRGCVRHDQTAGLWLLHGRKWKGAVDEAGAKRPQGEQRADPWVVVEPVARAIGVLERLHDQPLLFPTTLLPGGQARIAAGRQGKARTTQLVTHDITRLVAWINGYCATSGRATEQIPADPAGRDLAPSRFRRTLAWHIVRRPRGLVAGAIQYGHVEARLTLGYSGTYASGFPDEHAFEAWLLRLEQLADAEQRLAAGEHVSGPAAPTYRKRTHQATRKFAGRTLATTRQARTLLVNPALQVFPAKGMTCVFDPTKAKCRLKPTGDADRHNPDLEHCQPGCQNIAWTDQDIASLRAQAAELAALVDDPLSPAPLHERERHELERLRAIIDEHDRTRPPPANGGDADGQRTG